MYNQLIHPEDIQWVGDEVEKFMSSSQRTTQREYRIIDKNGNLHWIQESIQKFYEEIQKKRGVYGTLQDITERKRAEEALRESQELFTQFMDHLPAAVFIKNDESKTLFANKYLKDVFGGEKWIGKTTNELFPEEIARKMIADDQKALNEGLQIITEEIMDNRNVVGTYQTYKFPIKRENKENLLGGIAIDITVQKKAEEKLRESDERLRRFMESATDGFALLDSNLNFIDMNKAGLEWLGLSKEEIVGKNLLDIFPNLRNTERYDKYLEVMKTGTPYDIDDIISAPRIGQKYFSVRVFKVGEELGVITTDITDRVKAEKTREELEQRRDNFVWMTSHELRTPLTVLTGYCDFLIKHIKDLAQKRITNILSVMKSNLDRLELLASEVSTIGQIGRGIFEIEKTSMNLCDFLQDTIEPYHQLLGNQFDFQGCLDDASVIIDGDAHRLQQVLDNVISNAIKQTDKDHRKIMVTSKISPTDIKIEVSDNGAGIESENLEVIFEQFVSIPTEFSATGTGIGLHLCSKMLEAHGGRITAQSKGPGHGATFIIELPRKNP